MLPLSANLLILSSLGSDLSFPFAAAAAATAAALYLHIKINQAISKSLIVIDLQKSYKCFHQNARITHTYQILILDQFPSAFGSVS